LVSKNAYETIVSGAVWRKSQNDFRSDGGGNYFEPAAPVTIGTASAISASSSPGMPITISSSLIPENFR
jgi:hypothetical protein